MSYEQKSKPLADEQTYRMRLLRSILISAVLIFISLLIGILGYHFICKLGWVDALLNSSMILTGMGPVDRMDGNSAKLFASFYALFSGIAFLSTVGIIIAPILHRFMHRFHIDEE